MSHKTLVGGTSYTITGGTSLVSGTSYNIIGGRTLVGGTGYDISFTAKNPTAMLYSDGSFVIQDGSSVESGKTLTASYTNIEDDTGAPLWNGKQGSFTSLSTKAGIAPQNMAFWFHDAVNMTGNLSKARINARNSSSLSYAFANCHNLTGQPITGPNVIGMYSAYRNCYNLTGSPVCGPNVTSLAYAYCECSKLTGEPVVGDKVTDLTYAFYNCKNLRGGMPSAYRATSLVRAFANCWYLTGSPTCGPNVTNMAYAYDRCYNITGNAVCGNAVKDMAYAYFKCTNLTGSLICGANVTNAQGAFAEIGAKLGSDAYFFSPNIKDATSCVFNKSNSKRLNIYVPGGSITQTTVLNGTSGYSIVRDAITYTNSGSYYYNTAYNIYIYPVSNVAAGAGGGTYFGEPTAMLYSDGSLVFQLGESVATGKSLVASYTGFENTSTTPWNGKQKTITSVQFNCNVTPQSMARWFNGAKNNFIANIDSFINLNLNKVTNMHFTFGWGYKLTGSPICGPNVTNFSRTYESCYNITGSPVCGDRVVDMSSAYELCKNITGTPICGPNVTNMHSTYCMCDKLSGNAYFYSSKITNVVNCFQKSSYPRRLNLYVPSSSTTETTVLRSDASSLIGAEITYTNAGTYHYNTKYNIYIYPVSNVAAAREANGD